MTKRLGTAKEAADVLGVSPSTLHRSREAATLVVDHQSRAVRELTPEERADRIWQRRQHLVAPSLFGQQLPGRPWVFDLARLRRQMHQGPPGAEWTDPADIQHTSS